MKSSSSVKPSLSSTSGAGEKITLKVSGAAGRKYRIEASSDLETWTPLSTNVAVGGVVVFAEPAAREFHHRFYRAVLVPETRERGVQR